MLRALNQENLIETDAFKPPQEDLNNSLREEFKEIAVKDIINFRKVNFVASSMKSYPIVIKEDPVIIEENREKYFCIAGWEHIEKALEREEYSIRCLIKYVPKVTDQTLAILATGFRTKPEGGQVKYPEIIKAIINIFDLNPEEIYTGYIVHGGARCGEEYKRIKKDDFIDKELVPKLGLKRQTILNYLADGKYLSSELIDFLIAQGAGKEFFEKIRNKKNELVRKIEEGTAEESDEYDFEPYIEEMVSYNIKQIFKNFDPKKPTDDFSEFSFEILEAINEIVKVIIMGFKDDLQKEKELKTEEEINLSKEVEEVTFPIIGISDEKDNESNLRLVAGLKEIHEEIGKLINSGENPILKEKALEILVRFSRLLN